MNFVLLALFASLSFSLPRGGGASSVDALGQTFRAQATPLALSVAPPVAPPIALPAVDETAAAIAADDIPTCDPNPVKTGLPPTTLCRKDGSATLP